MNIAKLSIKRPIFISSIVLIIITLGIISYKFLGMDLMPDITFPVVTVTTIYPGATPEEIENLVAKPLEDEISIISGIKHVTSYIYENVSIIIIEFNLGIDLMNAEQQVRNKISSVRRDLPDDIEESLIERLNPNDTPILRYALAADLSQNELYDLAKEIIKPKIFQVNNVGDMKIIGATRREIQVELDRQKLNLYEIPALQVAELLKNSGVNMPIGKHESGAREKSFRAVGRFNSLNEIDNTLISFSGDINNFVNLKTLGETIDGHEDEITTAYLYYPFEDLSVKKDLRSGEKHETKRDTRPCLYIDIRKQSGANTIEVSRGIKDKVAEINQWMKNRPGKPQLIQTFDSSKFIEMNVAEVTETIIIGIILAILVIFLFLGTVRSTLITAIAIPTSLLGAVIMMKLFNFTLNVLSLMALSLTVGLLVDDAIVVIENIFRKIEGKLRPFVAAEEGTNQVMLAVIATTLAIIAVFLPIGLIQGVVGRYLQQFGFTVVFAMTFSLFIALTTTPMLCAYFAGTGEKEHNIVIRSIDRFQKFLDSKYLTVSRFSVDHPLIIIIITAIVFTGSIISLKSLKTTFKGQAYFAEFDILIEAEPGTSLAGTKAFAGQIESRIKKMPELNYIATIIGNDRGETNTAVISVFFIPQHLRNRKSEDLCNELRDIVKNDFGFLKPRVNEIKPQMSADVMPFTLNIKGNDPEALYKYSQAVREKIEKIPDLTEFDTSIKQGKPELQVVLDNRKLNQFGVAQRIASAELRYHVAGVVVGKLHENGLEYNVRMRLKRDQRDIKRAFDEIKVPNMHNRLVPLKIISDCIEKTGPSRIIRQDRNQVVKLTANLANNGAMGPAMERARMIVEKEIPLPEGITYSFSGEAEQFSELSTSFMVAMILSLIFIYLVLASLYESFITPITIMLAIPPAMSGAFYALFITGMMLDMMAMIGIISLIGLVTKNSILLVDFAVEGIKSGLSRKEAIIEAGRLRLRPILMTTFAMIAGTIPLALALGEMVKFRQGMGIAIIGGLVISTLVTLILVPAIFEYIDIFREKVERLFRPKDAGFDDEDVEVDITEDGKDAPANPFSEKNIKQNGKRKRVNKGLDN